MKKTLIDLSSLPSVEKLLQTDEVLSLISKYGRSLVVQSVRSEMEEIRKQAIEGGSIPQPAVIIDHSAVRLENITRNTLQPVINASGVILHTNMGRAPISTAAQKAIAAVSTGYNTLEFDIETGKRGARINHIEKMITLVTGAEAAFVVCNNAAAVLLSLSTLARRKQAVISRTQMVEIGDGFRIPEVLNQSGARLVEVGTTNRVNIRDYRAALEGGAAVILRVHHSNFKLTGFTSEPSLEEMVEETHRFSSVLIDNLGSGALMDTAAYGMMHEPMVQESVRAGADLVCFSGDKLVGGPQAGIIVGRKDLIQKVRRHPLARAVRADKMCIAGLTETFLHYAREEAEKEIPVWKMISTSREEIRKRANQWKDSLGIGLVRTSQSTVGGGSLPEETLPTWVLELEVKQPDSFLKSLRKSTPPVIARIEDQKVLLDPRTVYPEQDETLIMVLREAFTQRGLGK